ncbi:hypothetical protein A6046_03620 [[Haemophilus] ducreyi]|uniref:EamA domain-containing protein n=2 Tax=Haemophilus ducreyi TaxID=730 RepID=Q7VP90_HAEDU|nr:DMT family transporter [[Haemophilus] ducreyi]AAP95197.1 hypothetical protein HD_0206 [[Haemophilus] ducreyi 35000HP]AKO30349.1 membrane protein [[Haemophilus] ducreyi]AKO31781.1 membrane protein [[Haemophilus] ducreyi]AKO33233.1 membrane protein [[Haemophilus] ducreyi]AKO34683.1 membrane protein [[Haemophilus] ducreyi]
MKQSPLFGFFLATIAVIMWGLLPIVLQPIFHAMDAQTIVWFRFFSAMVGTFFILLFKKKLPSFKQIDTKQFLLILLGVFGLSCNFFLFNLALHYIPPAASQVITPLSSFIMIFASVVLFKEVIGIHQKIGLIILIIGLLLFFKHRLADFSMMNDYAFGILYAVTASLIWICYGIAQKLMLKRFSSLQILLMIYIGCSIIFTPVANFSQVFELTPFMSACLIFCCLNTVIAYGCYAEALNRWEVAKVSVMMTQIPIITIIFAEVIYYCMPGYFAKPELSLSSLIGALLVVCGAALSAIGHKIFYVNRPLDK